MSEEVLKRQVAIWQAEITRLQDLIAVATDRGEKQAVCSAIAQSLEKSKMRVDGWYWIKKRDWNDGYTGWTPALWRTEFRSWKSAEFSGIPDQEMIVGVRLEAPTEQEAIESAKVRLTSGELPDPVQPEL